MVPFREVFHRSSHAYGSEFIGAIVVDDIAAVDR